MTEDFNAINLDRIITALERLADSADAIASLLAAPAALAATGPRLGDDGWIEWNGGNPDTQDPSPVHADVWVDVKFDTGGVDADRAGAWRWWRMAGGRNITHYRVRQEPAK